MSSARVTHWQRTLDEFDEDGLPDKPLVIIDVNAETVRSPTGNGNIVGRIGPCKNREGYAFITRRDRREHYYRRGGGYALSKKLLHYLLNQVYHIMIHEKRRNRTLEFGIAQYVEDAERVQHAPKGDPQVCVPVEDARHVWHDYNAEFDVRGGA